MACFLSAVNIKRFVFQTIIKVLDLIPFWDVGEKDHIILC